MQAASRESYAATVEQLETVVASASPAELSTTADEILDVAGLLRGEPRLRRALADPSRAGADRSGLVRSMLGGRISDRAITLLGVLVSGRWSSPVELLDATEKLGVETLLASAEKADDLGEVEDELFRFGQVVDANPGLAAVLGDPNAPVEQRAALVNDLLKDRAKPATARLASLALAGFGGRGLAASLTRLVEAAAARRDRQVAYVTTAVLLTEAEETRLGARLAEMYGREIALKISVDPSIVGGLSVQVGNDLYDGTVSRRLAEARHALT
jgi:F-type H+-transporting ATPase subunit delta